MLDSETQNGNTILTYKWVEYACQQSAIILGEGLYLPTKRAYNVQALLLEDIVERSPHLSEGIKEDLVPCWVVPKKDKKTDEYNGDFFIKEPELCNALQHKYNLSYVNGSFYNSNGELADSMVKKLILQSLYPFLDTDVHKKLMNIFNLLQTTSGKQPKKPPENVIFTNDDKMLVISPDGDLEVKPADTFTLNRMMVTYNPSADCPRWKAFLDELLYADEIPLLQEYLGYCLTSSTRAQAGLFIIGEGEEGKSRIPATLSFILGKSAVSNKFHKLETDRFALAQLDKKLLFIDDDLQTSALRETGTIKQVITAEIPQQIERKGKDSVPTLLYAKFLCCGNSFPTALYDKTDGFYRRQIFLGCKPKPADRQVDRFLQDKLNDESEGIFAWMVEGLQRLIKNGYEFTRSETADQLKESQKAENPVYRLLNDENWIKYEPAKSTRDGTLSKVLYQVLLAYCDENMLDVPKNANSAGKEFTRQFKKKGVAQSNNITSGSYSGRGYTGVYLTNYAKTAIRHQT